MPAKPLSEAQIKEAAKLRSLFESWQDRIASKTGKKPSQLHAAEKLDITQGALNQYLNAKIPLNIDVAIKFAKLLDCNVIEFSENLHAALLELCKSVNQLNQNNAGYGPNETFWPFSSTISPAAYISLTADQKMQIENRIKIYLEDNQIRDSSTSPTR